MLRKLGKWIGISIGVVVVIAVCLYALNAYNNRPKKVIAFQAISLGAHMDEVAYSLGSPGWVSKPETLTLNDGNVVLANLLISKQVMEKEKTTYKDYFNWIYVSDYLRTEVEFDPATKTVIKIGCSPSEKQQPMAYCAVNGIGPGMKEDRVIDHLGPPSSSSIEGLTKHLEYANFNMEIYLVKREVSNITIRDMSNQK